MSGKTYATFGVARSWMQIRQAFEDRRNAEQNMTVLFQYVLKAELRIADRMGKPIEKLRILEIGPGQGMERGRYFGIKNEVIGLDLDMIPINGSIRDYFDILRANGFGRLAKTLGRKVIVGKANQRAWSKVVGGGEMKAPQMRQGDICSRLPELGQFDLVMSWSVFEHLSDPRRALENIIRILKPGGVIYLSVHLYTANNGHHDIRAFTGHESKLPVWAHLRPKTRDHIHPSAYLNQWRLSQWRALFASLTPGYEEVLEGYDHRARYKPMITPEIQTELDEFSDEELFTVDAIYIWQKPLYKEEASCVS